MVKKVRVAGARVAGARVVGAVQMHRRQRAELLEQVHDVVAERLAFQTQVVVRQPVEGHHLQGGVAPLRVHDLDAAARRRHTSGMHNLGVARERRSRSHALEVSAHRHVEPHDREVAKDQTKELHTSVEG